MITSLYENNIPMRFGVILYSSKLVNQIEISGGQTENDSRIEDDLSSLVISNLSFCGLATLPKRLSFSCFIFLGFCV